MLNNRTLINNIFFFQNLNSRRIPIFLLIEVGNTKEFFVLTLYSKSFLYSDSGNMICEISLHVESL